MADLPAKRRCALHNRNSCNECAWKDGRPYEFRVAPAPSADPVPLPMPKQPPIADPNKLHCRMNASVGGVSLPACRGEDYCSCDCDKCLAATAVAPAFYAARAAKTPAPTEDRVLPGYTAGYVAGLRDAAAIVASMPTVASDDGEMIAEFLRGIATDLEQET